MEASGRGPSASSSPISSADSDGVVTSDGSYADGRANPAQSNGAPPDKAKSRKVARAKDNRETSNDGDTDEGILREMVSFTLVLV